MNATYILFFALLIASGCNSSEVSSVCDEVENQHWLAALINQYNSSTDPKVEINAYAYRNQQVVALNIKDSPCDLRNVVYDCSGRIICQFGCVAMLNTCFDFANEATKKKLIFKN